MRTQDVIVIGILLWLLWPPQGSGQGAYVGWTTDENGNQVPIPLVPPPEPVVVPPPDYPVDIYQTPPYVPPMG